MCIVQRIKLFMQLSIHLSINMTNLHHIVGLEFFFVRTQLQSDDISRTYINDVINVKHTRKKKT